MSQPFPDTYKWLREATALDAKMELIGLLYDGAPLDKSDIWDVVEEVAYKTVVHLVENTSLLTTYLMRDGVVFPCTEPSYLERLIIEVPLKAPLSFLPDMHRRIAAARANGAWQRHRRGGAVPRLAGRGLCQRRAA